VNCGGIRYRNTAAHLRDAKGLADLHTLLTRPGTDVHVLELAGATHAEPASGTLLDTTARLAYKRRLAELDHDLAAARADHDIGRAHHLDTQRTALVAELRRATGLTGRSRSLGASTTERARKTVTSRLREAVRRIHAVLPELGEHLDRSILTGTTCRYRPTTPMTWKTQGRRQVARIPTADAEQPVGAAHPRLTYRAGRARQPRRAHVQRLAEHPPTGALISYSGVTDGHLGNCTRRGATSRPPPLPPPSGRS
jgi:hypothetical protein